MGRNKVFKTLVACLISSSVAISTVANVYAARAYTYEDAALEFYKTLEFINDEYYFKDEVDYKKMLDAALTSAFETLDAYSGYLSKAELDDFMSAFDTNLVGMGIQSVLNADGNFNVRFVLPNSPAEQAGLLYNDVITKINDTVLNSMTYESARALMKGKEGASIKLTVLRDGNELDFNVTLKSIYMPLAYQANLKDYLPEADTSKTAYVILTTFGDDTYSSFCKIHDKLVQEGIKNLILDLRGNPGGTLESSIEIGKMLVKEGSIITFAANDGSTITISSELKNPPFNIAVLVDGDTASASEVLASAIQESGSGILVGSKTYGKGVGQEIVDSLSGTHNIKITNIESISRNGNHFNKVGITPNIPVNLPDFVYSKTPITPDSASADIVALKKILAYLGYNVDSSSSVYSDDLVAAIESIQEKYSFPIDGRSVSLDVQYKIDYLLNDILVQNDLVLKTAYDALNK